jgi:hypothetical protein
MTGPLFKKEWKNSRTGLSVLSFLEGRVAFQTCKEPQKAIGEVFIKGRMVGVELSKLLEGPKG